MSTVEFVIDDAEVRDILGPRRGPIAVVPRSLRIGSAVAPARLVVEPEYRDALSPQSFPVQYLESILGPSDWQCQVDAASGVLRGAALSVTRVPTPDEPMLPVVATMIGGRIYTDLLARYRAAATRIDPGLGEIHAAVIEACFLLLASGALADGRRLDHVA